MKRIASLMLLLGLAAPALAQFNYAPSQNFSNTIPYQGGTVGQQYSSYNSGSQFVGGSIMNNGSLQQSYVIPGYQQPTVGFAGSPYGVGTGNNFYSQLNRSSFSQSVVNRQFTTQGQSFGGVYSQPVTNFNTANFGGSLVGSQNSYLRQTTGFAANVARSPFRAARRAFR